jgi:hypothetical protein
MVASEQSFGKRTNGQHENSRDTSIKQILNTIILPNKKGLGDKVIQYIYRNVPGLATDFAPNSKG